MGSAWTQQPQLLDTLLIFILISVSVIAICAIWRAKTNLELEHRVLQTVKDGKKDIGITKIDNLIQRFRNKEIRDEAGKVITDPYTAAVRDAGYYGEALDSSASVQCYLYAESSREGGAQPREVPLHSGYVSDRLYAILSSVNTNNLVRKAPPLEDLHELTMQRERGGVATSLFRMIAPGILVLGILGTLLGVHQRLAEVDEKGVFVLSDALMPGAYAVFFTVIVMACRGYYNGALSRFVSDFNEYTLTCLLPFFRPVSQSQADLNSLEQAMYNAATSCGKLQKLSSAVISYKSGMQVYEDSVFHLMDDVCKSLDECRSMAKYRRDEFLHEQLWQQKAAGFAVRQHAGYAALNDSLHDIQERILETEQLILQVCAMGGRVWKSAGKWVEQRETINNILQSGTDIHDSVHRFPSLQQYIDSWQKLAAWMKGLSAEMRAYKSHVRKIDVFDGNIDTNIKNYLCVAYVSKLEKLVNRLETRYSSLKEGSDKLKEAGIRCRKRVQEQLEEEKNVLLKLLTSLNKEAFHDYPHGWKGLPMRLKNLMMKWERDVGPWLFILLWLTTVGWTITLIID